MNDDTNDPLLRALRELPRPAMDPTHERRTRETARAAFARAAADGPSDAPILGMLGRAAVPIALATVVGIYLTWAIGAATSLVR
jgi:hypothetical protein